VHNFTHIDSTEHCTLMQLAFTWLLSFHSWVKYNLLIACVDKFTDVVFPFFLYFIIMFKSIGIYPIVLQGFLISSPALL